jgi:hypothetical protein
MEGPPKSGKNSKISANMPTSTAATGATECGNWLPNRW